MCVCVCVCVDTILEIVCPRANSLQLSPKGSICKGSEEILQLEIKMEGKRENRKSEKIASVRDSTKSREGER